MHEGAERILQLQVVLLLTLGRFVCGLPDEGPAPFSPPPALRLYVEEVPARFVNARTVKLQSNASLGMPRVDANGEVMWASAYMWLDYWVSHLVRTSVLRTLTRDDSDVVFVPYHVPDLVNDGLDAAALCDEALAFFNEAPSFLPMLGKVPHVMTVSQPPTIYASACPAILDASVTGNYTFLSVEDSFHGPTGDIVRLPNFVAAAYFGQVHYAPNSTELLNDPSGASFDEEAVMRQKQLLCLGSWRTRGTMPLVQRNASALLAAAHPYSWWRAWLTKLARHFGFQSMALQNHERWVLRAQCLARRGKCEHVEAGEISSEKPMDDYFAAVFKTKFVTTAKSRAAWFVLMPHGDFVTRGAFYDALLAASIPVMLRNEFRRFYPYADILNYDAFTVSIPYAEVFGSKANGGGGGEAWASSESKLHAPAHDFNVVDAVESRFNVSTRLAKLRAVYAVRRLMQWSLEPVHELVRFDARNVIEDGDDAFTFTFKALLRNLCERGCLPAARCGASSGERAAAATAALIQHE